MPIPVVNPQNGDDLTAQSITTNVTDRVVSWAGVHEIGGVTGGAVRHLNDQIDAKSLPETTTPTQTPANQHLYNDSTYAALSGWLGAYAGGGFIAKVVAAAGDLTYKGLVALLRSHSHADSTHGGVLVQTSTHGGAAGTGNDIDVATTSIHHTLGAGGTQAAAGNHTHANMEVTTNKGAANGYAGLNGSGLLPTTVLPTAVTVTAAAWTVGNATNATTAAGVTAGAIDTTALAANAVTSAKILDGTIQGTDIAAATIAGGNIAATTITGGNMAVGTVTTTQIADGTITGADIAATTITAANIAGDTITAAQIAANAITASELADNAVDTAAILDANVTTAKLADQAVTNGKIADYSIAMTKFLEGAILPTAGTPNLSVTINSLHKWNANGSGIFFGGGSVDLTAYVPTSASQNVYVLLEINATNTIHVKGGTPTTSALTDADRPTADINTTPVGFVTLATGQSQILAAHIQPWIGLGGFPGSAISGGSPVGHRHNQLPENKITGDAQDEGWAAPTATPSYSILINPLHYRLSSGIVQFRQQTTFGTFAVPVSGYRTYGVYLDPLSGSYAMTAASDNSVYPPIYPAFSGNQRSICYVHLTGTSANIKAGDDGSGGGWIEDARVWLAGSGPNTTPVGVTDGGSGQSAFAFSGLLMAGVGSTTAPYTEVAATSSVTQGLAIAPPLTPGAADHALVALGGAVVAMGTSSMTNSVAVDAVPATRSGSSGNATNAYTLRSTGPTYGTAINAAGYFKTGAAAGIAAIFDTVASPSGDINQYKANGTLVGRVTGAGLMTAGGAHAAGAVVHAVAPTTGTIVGKFDAMAGQTADIGRFDASAIANGQTAHFDKAGRLTVTQGTAPAIAVSAIAAGAGVGATASIVGTDQAGVITINTGTGLSGVATLLATITFRNAYAATPNAFIVTPASYTTMSLARNQDVTALNGGVSAGAFGMYSGNALLAASTTYQWYYWIIG